jgi:hypothetical protein
MIFAAIFIIGYKLIGNLGLTFLQEVTVDYDSKKIICTFRNYNKELEKIHFNFDEIEVNTYNSKGQGTFLLISEAEKELSFNEGKLGLESLDFSNLRVELNQIEHQNSAWWRNMEGVFPRISQEKT